MKFSLISIKHVSQAVPAGSPKNAVVSMPAAGRHRAVERDHVAVILVDRRDRHGEPEREAGEAGEQGEDEAGAQRHDGRVPERPARVKRGLRNEYDRAGR